MLKEFVDRILELKREVLVQVGERTYATEKLQPIIPPLGECVQVHTLTGLVDLYRAELDDMGNENIAFHIFSHDQVRIIHLRSTKWGQRHWYARAVLPEMQAFPFGDWISPEKFIIGLQSMFLPSEAQKALLGLCSNISAESLSISDDDGISQKATVTRGVVFKENQTIKPIVELQPYRTFSEVDQPSSNFLFRLHQFQDGKTVQCMLTEADGGVWRQKAMASIKEWFEGQSLDEVPIIS